MHQLQLDVLQVAPPAQAPPSAPPAQVAIFSGQMAFATLPAWIGITQISQPRGAHPVSTTASPAAGTPPASPATRLRSTDSSTAAVSGAVPWRDTLKLEWQWPRNASPPVRPAIP
jgi:hypothetical protein